MKHFSLTLMLSLTLLIGPNAFASEVLPLSQAKLDSLFQENKGKVIVLNIWATWCPACVQEYPELLDLREKVSPEKLTILSLAVDQNESAIIAFLRAKPATFPVFIDTGEVTKNLDVNAIPRTLVFSPEGTKVFDHEGYLSENQLLHVIKKAR